MVLPPVIAQLAHGGRLGHVLVGQRRHDPLKVRPLPEDQFAERLARRAEECVAIGTRVLESDQLLGSLLQVLRARREPAAENVQGPAVDMVRAVLLNSWFLAWRDDSHAAVGS